MEPQLSTIATNTDVLAAGVVEIHSRRNAYIFEWCTRSQYNCESNYRKTIKYFARPERYHKRCIYCYSKWFFFAHTRPGRPSYYLATATCQEVFMSHGFVSRFYYRVRLFNALYIMCMSAVAFFKKSFISWLFLILCINFAAAIFNPFFAHPADPQLCVCMSIVR